MHMRKRLTEIPLERRITSEIDRNGGCEHCLLSSVEISGDIPVTRLTLGVSCAFLGTDHHHRTSAGSREPKPTSNQIGGVSFQPPGGG